MQVPAFDLTRQNKRLQPELEETFRRITAGGHFILGEDVPQFETEIARYLGVKHAIGVANGSDALLLALLALGIGPGDEVIIPSFTFFATAGAVSRVGGTPVFVEVSEEDYNIIPEQIRLKITPRTKAVIPVHLFGMPARMKEIMAIAAEHKLAVIEDVAQALGTTCDGRQAGTIGDVGCFSFFPTKNLGCFGDGGMVITQRDDLAEKLRMLRVHGAKKKYYHEMLGFNSRLDTMQAAILRLKIPYLNENLAARRRIAAAYREGLRDTAQITLPTDHAGHTYNQFTIRTPQREMLQAYLSEQGIGTTIYYPRGLHRQPVFTSLGYAEGSLPVTERLTAEVLSLPAFPEITTEEQVYVIDAIRRFDKENR